MADQYGYTAQLLEGLFSGDKGQLRQQRQQMQLSQLQQMQQQRESEMKIQAQMMENQSLLYEQAKKDVVRDKDKEYLRDMLNKGITYMQSEIDQKYNGNALRWYQDVGFKQMIQYKNEIKNGKWAQQVESNAQAMTKFRDAMQNEDTAALINPRTVKNFQEYFVDETVNTFEWDGLLSEIDGPDLSKQDQNYITNPDAIIDVGNNAAKLAQNYLRTYPEKGQEIQKLLGLQEYSEVVSYVANDRDLLRSYVLDKYSPMLNKRGEQKVDFDSAAEFITLNKTGTANVPVGRDFDFAEQHLNSVGEGWSSSAFGYNEGVRAWGGDYVNGPSRPNLSYQLFNPESEAVMDNLVFKGSGRGVVQQPFVTDEKGGTTKREGSDAFEGRKVVQGIQMDNGRVYKSTGELITSDMIQTEGSWMNFMERTFDMLPKYYQEGLRHEGYFQALKYIGPDGTPQIVQQFEDKEGSKAKDYNELYGNQKPEVVTVVALTDPELFNDYFLYEVKPDRAFYAQMNQAYADIDKEYSEVTGDVLDAKTKAAMDVAKGKERANSAKALGTIYADGDPEKAPQTFDYIATTYLPSVTTSLDGLGAPKKMIPYVLAEMLVKSSNRIDLMEQQSPELSKDEFNNMKDNLFNNTMIDALKSYPTTIQAPYSSTYKEMVRTGNVTGYLNTLTEDIRKEVVRQARLIRNAGNF